MNNDIPEPHNEPPEDDYITARCGHEVSGDDTDEKGRPDNFLITWHGIKKCETLCPECFRAKVSALPTDELAYWFGCEVQTVERR
ncbi:hypothetical protein SAMN02745823_03840 [Sporobacter termitidis DSM 10068]|uniref:Uncharacterized protein n=2 Tax=Sporobacter TaxID=44748 RepID=A0A1M5ZJZ1_9FIRM|nr:hypothetical protein [Sporobacter termitidis]SHI23776.1 hypothetical protein SAMN02745823_03762 [Sporobacter termitidis DSM 10068]SHI24468.1 hypothetical protein SAMN02745823_03840 [Sporobacter termitidis DSM 10068]